MVHFKIGKKAVALFIFLVTASPLWADDGMWLLALLNKYNAAELKRMGLKIPVEDISGEKDGSLSEAVVAFGSGCTGSIISSQGLIVTNYHCSYSAIQQLNTPSRDISNKGYWANSTGQEMPVSGLSVTINKRILDITAEVKTQLAKNTSASAIKQALEQVQSKYEKAFPKYRVLTKSYRNNTLFVLFLQVQYNDIRLVGLAPKDVAKFGGETDNWMWPRQSADFAFFRVYGDKNGNPASFNSNNKPLPVKTYLHISTEGYKQGDFTMSMGFPSQSDRNATAAQIREKINVVNPAMIAARKQRLAILEEAMAASERNRMTYAEKYATSANYYKNAVGMNYWVDKLGIIAKKESFEKNWLKWAATNNRQSDDRAILNSIKMMLEDNAAYKRAMTYSGECFVGACSMIEFISGFGKRCESFTADAKKDPSSGHNFMATLNMYYRGFDPAVDKRVTKAMMRLVFDSLPASLRPDIFETKELRSASDIDEYVDEVFATSVFADSARLKIWLKNPQGSILSDPAYQLTASIGAKHMELIHLTLSNGAKLSRSLAVYNASLAEYKDNFYYPDADRTIRLSYGTISDLAVDGKTIPFQTTLAGLIKKADIGNKDYALNRQLAALWKSKDFGKYGNNGDMPVCFITNGDVTGGNSGSPMLNGDGKIIGLVFDCNWESMTREFNYEKSLHRVICTDIRYVLLLTEKFSGSKRIVDEINASDPVLSAKR